MDPQPLKTNNSQTAISPIIILLLLLLAMFSDNPTLQSRRRRRRRRPSIATISRPQRTHAPVAIETPGPQFEGCVEDLDINLEESDEDIPPPQRPRALIIECRKTSNHPLWMHQKILSLWKEQMNITQNGPYDEPLLLSKDPPFVDFIRDNYKHPYLSVWNGTWKKIINDAREYYISTAIFYALQGQETTRLNQAGTFITYFNEQRTFIDSGLRQTQYSIRRHPPHPDIRHPRWPWKDPLAYSLFTDIIKGRMSQNTADHYIPYHHSQDPGWPACADVLFLWSDHCWGPDKVYGLFDQFDEEWLWVGSLRDIKEQLTNVLHTPCLMNKIAPTPEMKSKLIIHHPLQDCRRWFKPFKWGQSHRHDTESMAFKFPFYLCFGKFAAYPVPAKWTDWVDLPDKSPSNKREDPRALMSEFYKGVAFIIPGIPIWSARQRKLLFVQDILHDDFDPSPLPKESETPKTWHTRLKKIAEEWESSKGQQHAYAIKTKCRLRCVELHVDWDKSDLEGNEIWAFLEFNRSVPSTNLWWGKGFIWENWDPRDDDFDWEPCRIQCNDRWYEQSPILDDFVEPERLITVHLNEIKLHRGAQISTLPIHLWLPAIKYYTRPYVEMFKEERMNDPIPSFAFALDLFFDGFHVTVGSTGQVLQPLGGYFSIINLFGNKELILEWGMIPKYMDYYTFGAFVEKQLMKMTFEGWVSNFWNPWKRKWMKGRFFVLPLRFTGDLPEIRCWTEITTSDATKICRYITQFWDEKNKLGSHGSWKKNAWVVTDILMGNVEYPFSFLGRIAGLMMEVIWNNKSAKRSKLFNKVTFTITHWFRAMGISLPKKWKPMPFNYYNMPMIAISECAHARLMGILGTTYRVILKCVGTDHLQDMQYYWNRAPKSRGLSSIMNITRYKNGKDPQASKKAIKLWTSSLVLYGHCELFGICQELREFLRIHLMILGRWFSPDFNLFDHFKLRYYMVYLEQQLCKWGDNKEGNAQTFLMFRFLWRTRNIKNWLISWDIHTFIWGGARSQFRLLFENFHKEVRSSVRFFNYRHPQQLFLHQLKRGRTVELDMFSKLGLCRRQAPHLPFYGRDFRYGSSRYLNGELPLVKTTKQNLFPPGMYQMYRLDFSKVWTFYTCRFPFTDDDWAQFRIRVASGIRRSKRLHKHTHDVYPYLSHIGAFLIYYFNMDIFIDPLPWLLKHLFTHRDGQRLQISWIFQSDQNAMSYADDNYKSKDLAWARNRHDIHSVGRVMCMVEIDGLQSNYFLGKMRNTTRLEDIPALTRLCVLNSFRDNNVADFKSNLACYELSDVSFTQKTGEFCVVHHSELVQRLHFIHEHVQMPTWIWNTVHRHKDKEKRLYGTEYDQNPADIEITREDENKESTEMKKESSDDDDHGSDGSMGLPSLRIPTTSKRRGGVLKKRRRANQMDVDDEDEDDDDDDDEPPPSFIRQSRRLRDKAPEFPPLPFRSMSASERASMSEKGGSKETKENESSSSEDGDVEMTEFTTTHSQRMRGRRGKRQRRKERSSQSQATSTTTPSPIPSPSPSPSGIPSLPINNEKPKPKKKNEKNKRRKFNCEALVAKYKTGGKPKITNAFYKKMSRYKYWWALDLLEEEKGVLQHERDYKQTPWCGIKYVCSHLDNEGACRDCILNNRKMKRKVICLSDTCPSWRLFPINVGGISRFAMGNTLRHTMKYDE